MFRTTCRPLQAVFFSRASVKVAPKVNPISVISHRSIMQQSTRMPTIWTFSKTVAPASSSRILAMVATATAAPLAFKKPVLCQAFASPLREPLDPASSVKPEDRAVSKSLFHTGEITFGAFLGVCTGYLIKKVGKLFAMMVGVGFVFLQYCSSKGFVSVHWDRIENNWWKRGLDVDADGKVTKTDLKNKWNMVVGFLTQNLQFKSSFTAGLYAGIRYG
ncbi:hypothetical protein VKS41_002353 [Umbelopsis sp. WA50703]